MRKNCQKKTFLKKFRIVCVILIFMIICMPKVNANRYIMTYLYGTGDYKKMIEERGNVFNEVSPSYFDINENGTLKTNYVDNIFIKDMHNKGIKVVPFLSNHWNRELGRKALKNYEYLSSQIVSVIEKNNLDGVNVDIENLTESDRENYIKLVKRLRERLSADKLLVVSVAANPYDVDYGWQGSYDYGKLAEYADYLMIMAYDEHYEGGENGPVASINFIENSVKYAISKVSKDKIVLGIPLYGRYWDDSTNTGGYGVSLSKIEDILKKYTSKITYDKSSESVKAEVTIKESDEALKLNGKTLSAGKYIFWYENNESIDTKLNLVEKYDIKGMGMWKVGLETTSVWDVIENKFSEVISEIKQTFKDVKTDYWAYDDIEYVHEKGLMIGKNVDTFEGESNLTRGELVTIIARIIEKANLNLENSQRNPQFNDISNHWAKDNIIKLSKIGLVNGYENGQFKPDSRVTRAEASAIVARLLEGVGGLEIVSFENDYIDLSESHWAYEKIIALKNNGVLNGYEDGSFKPENSIKRAEIAKIIRKIYEKVS